MKAKVINLFLVLSLFVMVSCGGGMKSKLAATWQLEGIEGMEMTDKMKEATLTFAKDGSFTENMDKADKGKWELNEKEKTIVLKYEGGKERKLTELALDKDKMTVRADGKGFTFKKK
ncbi:MAG: copper resistance protein NlpE [Microscillaceae bacterium]|jgi:hypothetical protein|nr:copper resistance protein NlpE [Microscillaceae bacterium]